MTFLIYTFHILTIIQKILSKIFMNNILIWNRIQRNISINIFACTQTITSCNIDYKMQF